MDFAAPLFPAISVSSVTCLAVHIYKKTIRSVNSALFQGGALGLIFEVGLYCFMICVGADNSNGG